jgi:hypothetical protein
MHLKVEIQDSGAAFDETPATETARILRKLADIIERDGIFEGGDELRLFDLFGNRCGFARFEREA